MLKDGGKKMRKTQGYFVGDRLGFGFNVVDGHKVQNRSEQVLIAEMWKMKEAGSSLLAIQRWLTAEKEVKLAYSSTRGVYELTRVYWQTRQSLVHLVWKYDLQIILI